MFKSKHSGWTWDLRRTPLGGGDGEGAVAVGDAGIGEAAEGGGDGGEEVLGVGGAAADAAPAEEELGAIEGEIAEDLGGDEIGYGLSDMKLGLGEEDALAPGIFEGEHARAARGGGGGLKIRGARAGSERQFNSDIASEPFRRPYPHWAGMPPQAWD